MTDLGRVSLLPNEDSVWCCNPAPQIGHNEASGVTDTVYTHSYIQDQQYTMYSTKNSAVGRQIKLSMLMLPPYFSLSYSTSHTTYISDVA